jgi:hypothetical protein
MSAPIDPTVMLLRSFFLTTMAGQYEEVMQRAEKDGWRHRQVLRHLCESEAVERGQKHTAGCWPSQGCPRARHSARSTRRFCRPRCGGSFPR